MTRRQPLSSRTFVLVAALCLATVAGAQQSAGYKLEEHTFNAGDGRQAQGRYQHEGSARQGMASRHRPTIPIAAERTACTPCSSSG